jgi:hypothetical protein
MNRTILLASFMGTKDIDIFFKKLKDKYNIQKTKVFVFEHVDDPTKLIVTFKLVIKNNIRFNIKKDLPNSILIHKRGTAIYTINALNKLIENTHPETLGNINYSSVKIDWSKFQNKLLTFYNDELKICDIKRIF